MSESLRMLNVTFTIFDYAVCLSTFHQYNEIQEMSNLLRIKDLLCLIVF